MANGDDDATKGVKEILLIPPMLEYQDHSSVRPAIIR